MKKEDLKLIKKYLNGDTTPAEANYVRNHLISQLSDEDELTKQLLLEEWEQTSSENISGIEMNEAWAEFKQRATGFSPREIKPIRKIWVKQLLVAATIVGIMASAAVFYLFSIESEPQLVLTEEVTYTLKSTGRGEKLSISLPDGSNIRLNSSTTLRIPSNYNNERIVYLDGEAFFEVSKYENKNFKVISGQVTTEVLGTSFNINTFSDSKDVSVAVVEGKVQVANNNHAIVLNPQEMTVVNPSTKQLTKNYFEVDYITGWRNNLLVFEKVSFDEMIEKLRHWYGVEFIIVSGDSPKGKYSGRFENKSLQLVLEGLGFSSAFEYKIIDKIVYLRF